VELEKGFIADNVITIELTEEIMNMLQNGEKAILKDGRIEIIPKSK
jgi:hypothetical protein